MPDRVPFFWFAVAIAVMVVGWAVALGLALWTRRGLGRSQEERDRYRRISERDSLCDILNKGALVARLRESFSQKSPFVTGTLFLMDIDHFKQVNDQHGHAEGDEVLRLVGQGLNASFRSTDVVGRFGGDEFMVFAEGLADEDVIKRKVAAIHSIVRLAGEKSIGEPLTCSIGVLCIRLCSVTYEDVLRQVDAALYEAKRAGRNRAAWRDFVDGERAPADADRVAGANGEHASVDADRATGAGEETR